MYTREIQSEKQRKENGRSQGLMVTNGSVPRLRQCKKGEGGGPVRLCSREYTLHAKFVKKKNKKTYVS